MTGCAFRFLQATTKGTTEKRTAKAQPVTLSNFSETGKHRSEPTRSSCVTAGEPGIPRLRDGLFDAYVRSPQNAVPNRPKGGTSQASGNGKPAAGRRNPAGTHRTARLRKAGRVRRGEYAPTAGQARPGSRAPRPPVRCGASPRYAALPAHSLRGTRRR